MNFPPPTARQARILWLALTGLALAVLVALIGALVWGIGEVIRTLSPVLWPLALAGVLAYLLDPVVDFVESKGVPRARSIILVFALALMIVAALFGSVVPRIVRETGDLVSRVPGYVERGRERILHWVNNPPNFLKHFFPAEPAGTNAPPPVVTTNTSGVTVTNDPARAPGTNAPSVLTTALESEKFQSATAWLAGTLPTVGAWVFGQVGRVASWFGMLVGLALVPIYAFYFLLEKRGISSRWTDYLPVSDSSLKDELVFLLNSTNSYLIAFFRGQVLVAICDGILYATGFLIIGLPYAVLLGAVAIGLTMIPFLGAIITCIVALLLALVQWGDWLHPLLVLAVFAVVQGLEGAIISPKIMGDRVGLHPVTIIVAVMVGTTLLGGILGGVLAIPLTAVLRVVMFRYVWKRPDSRDPDQKPEPAKKKR